MPFAVVEKLKAESDDTVTLADVSANPEILNELGPIVVPVQAEPKPDKAVADNDGEQGVAFRFVAVEALIPVGIVAVKQLWS